MPITPSISTWNRVEPQPRANDVKPALRAELRDPAWLLGRQWQLGEFAGEDAASPAFVDLAWRTTDLRQWTAGTATAAVDGKMPLERPTLAEPHTPDQATRVELGQVFLRLLADAYKPAAVPAGVLTAFQTAKPLPAATGTTFDALEDSTRQFQLVVVGRALDGVGIMALAQAGTIPGTLPQADKDKITAVYPLFLKWVERVYGSIGTTAPPAWDPQRLDNRFTVTAGPAATPNAATLAAQPDADGRLEWSSFDLAAQASDPFAGTTAAAPLRIAPTHLRFPGMPANRYWDFEEGDLALPDIDVEKRDLQKLLVVEFALVSGVDWFVLPLEVAVGKLARIDSLVVRDVFGGRTTINRADDVGMLPATKRWTMFSVAQPGGTLASFTVVPPSAGPALVRGPALEEVRFARDEMANMAWAIERTTESRMGEPRAGSERDAAADAATAPATPPGPVDEAVPLKYQIESKVPVNWIPLVAVPDPARPPAIQLQKARVLRPGPGGQPAAVPPLGKILKPEPYLLPEEEVPRAGLRVERVLFRSRWIDGSAHLWVARRRGGGAGETQSGLRFDAALPNRT